jgi:hypothetical protein
VRYNGLFIVLDLAIRSLDEPLVNRYRDALVLGSLREDVWYFPVIDLVFEHWSFSHFYAPPLPGGYLPLIWPGPRSKGELFYRRALREHRRGRVAAGFVQLGRVAHLMTDMCCPVHVHRTVHQTDPFEWYVEGNKKTLLALPVPAVPDAAKPSDLLRDLADHTRHFRDDRTNHHLGRVLRRLGLRRSVSAREAGAQARELIPLAAGYTASLLRLYLRDAAA